MGAFEDYWEELKLKEAQRQAQAQADLNDLELAQKQRTAEINDETLRGEHYRDPSTLTGMTAEQARQAREEYAANRPKELANEALKGFIAKEQALRNTSREQTNQYFDQARKVSSLAQMRFGTDPQFDQQIPYDDDVRNETVRDPRTGAVTVQPKPGLDERKARIAEYAKHLQIPEEVVSRRFDEDAIAKLKAEEAAAGLQQKQRTRMEEERLAPYLREKAHITMAQQLGTNEALLQQIESNPNSTDDMIRAAQYARVMQQGKTDLGEEKNLQKWEVYFLKEHIRNFDEAVRRGDGTYNGINIEDLVDNQGLQPGERPKLITEYLTKLSRDQAAAQIQSFRNPENHINQVRNNILDADQMTEQQIAEGQRPTMPGVEYGGGSSPLREPGGPAQEQEPTIPVGAGPASLQEMFSPEYQVVRSHTPRGGRGMVSGGPGTVAPGRANPLAGQVPRREYELTAPGGRGLPRQGPAILGGGRGRPAVDFLRPGISLEEWLWRARQKGTL